MQLKVYRKDNRKKDLGRWRRYLLRFGALAGFVVLGLVFYRLSGPVLIAAASLRDFVVESDYFSVREIQVRGGAMISGNEIVSVAGLSKGMNIWKIDPAGIERTIAKHPWVRRVLVHREFPHRITIDVEERTPRAIVAIRKLYYVDADGVIFKEVQAGDKMNYPMLTGLSTEQLTKPDPTLRKRDSRSDASRRADGRAFALAVGNSFRSARSVSRLHGASAHGAAHGLGRLGGQVGAPRAFVSALERQRSALGVAGR